MVVKRSFSVTGMHVRTLCMYWIGLRFSTVSMKRSMTSGFAWCEERKLSRLCLQHVPTLKVYSLDTNHFTGGVQCFKI